MSGSVIRIRTSAHARAASLGLAGRRECRDCGQDIVFVKTAGGKWAPRNPDKGYHNCGGDRLQRQRVRKGQA